jgi:hypothetical protein
MKIEGPIDDVSGTWVNGRPVMVTMPGVKLDGETYEAGWEEARAAGFPRETWSHVSLFLGGVRSGQKPCVCRGDVPLVAPLVRYLYRRGEVAAAFATAMLVWPAPPPRMAAPI